MQRVCTPCDKEFVRAGSEASVLQVGEDDAAESDEEADNALQTAEILQLSVRHFVRACRPVPARRRLRPFS